MRMTRLFSAILAGALCVGCFNSDEEPAVYSCENPPDDSDDHGRCYVYREDWAAWAQTISDGELDGAVELGILTPLDGDLECYALTGSTVTPCVVQADGVDLYGIPADQLTLAYEQCAGLGPWTEVATGHGECFGIVDGVAVLLDRDRAIPVY